MRPPQFHYVLGWTIIVVSHNWPVLLALILTAVQAIRLWCSPTRKRVALVYASALLVVAYEYHKHIGPQLQDAANYLLMFELLHLNRAVHMLVGPVTSIGLVGLSGAFAGYAMLFADNRHPERASHQPLDNCKNTS